MKIFREERIIAAVGYKPRGRLTGLMLKAFIFAAGLLKNLLLGIGQLGGREPGCEKVKVSY